MQYDLSMHVFKRSPEYIIAKASGTYFPQIFYGYVHVWRAIISTYVSHTFTPQLETPAIKCGDRLVNNAFIMPGNAKPFKSVGIGGEFRFRLDSPRTFVLNNVSW